MGYGVWLMVGISYSRFHRSSGHTLEAISYLLW